MIQNTAITFWSQPYFLSLSLSLRSSLTPTSLFLNPLPGGSNTFVDANQRVSGQVWTESKNKIP